MAKNTSTATDDTATGTAWLSVAAASAALDVSQKTVWRRARSGELTARKVSGARGALVWEICLDASGQTDRPNGQKQAAKQPDKRPKAPEYDRESSGQTDRTATGQTAQPNGQSDGATDGTGARFMAHLEEENKFLRAALEQRDRDAAELRAALRAALKLTAGTSAPQLTTSDAPTIATDGAQRDEKRGTAKDSPKGAKGSGRGTSAQESAAIDYGAICDLIEKGMNQ